MAKKVTVPVETIVDGSPVVESQVLKRPEVLALLNENRPGDFKSVYWNEVDGATHVTVYLNVPEDGHKTVVEKIFSAVTNPVLVVRQKRIFVKRVAAAV